MTDEEDEGLTQQEERRLRSRLTSHSTTNLNDPHQYLSILSQARPIPAAATEQNRGFSQRTRRLFLPVPQSTSDLPTSSALTGPDSSASPTPSARESSPGGTHRDTRVVSPVLPSPFRSSATSDQPFVPCPLPMRLEDMVQVPASPRHDYGWSQSPNSHRLPRAVGKHASVAAPGIH